MTNPIISHFRRRLAQWLATDIANELRANGHEAESHAPVTPPALTPADRQAMERDLLNLATISESATIGPEGLVENLRGDPRYIRVGDHSYVRGRLLTYGHAGEISIGDWCYIGVRTEIWSMASVSIGNRVLVSHGVNIIDGSSHSSDAAERHQHFRTILTAGHPKDPADVPGVTGEPIIIEDDAWISFGATILKGVRIGKGSIVAAGSIVTKDVPPRMLYRNKVEPLLTPLAGG